VSDEFDQGMPSDHRPVVHLLRIGKTGSTALVDAFRAADRYSRIRVACHGHEVTLAQLPPGEPWVFTARDPIDRFVSAFGSRMRRGRPRYDYPHSQAEARAFARFSHPHDLGAALDCGDWELRAEAERAMRSISHVRSSYWDWFENPDTLQRRRGECLAMLRTRTLDTDAPRLAARLGIPPDRFQLPRTAEAAHRNPPLPPRPAEVTARSRANLRGWYAADYEFLDLADAWFAE